MNMADDRRLELLDLDARTAREHPAQGCGFVASLAVRRRSCDRLPLFRHQRRQTALAPLTM
jgi:hypothetical protein